MDIQTKKSKKPAPQLHPSPVVNMGTELDDFANTPDHVYEEVGVRSGEEYCMINPHYIMHAHNGEQRRDHEEGYDVNRNSAYGTVGRSSDEVTSN